MSKTKHAFFILPFSFLLLLIFLVSCSTQRKIIKAPIKEEGADYLFKKLKEHELQYALVHGKIFCGILK